MKTAKQKTTTKESYTYDAVGNRLSSLGVSPYTYNSSNELQTIPGVTYAYDNNGSLQTKTDATGATGYTWDYENRLTQVSMPGTAGTVNYKYDPFGRRVQKAFTQSGNTTTTNYVYDGANVIEELDQFGAAVARYVQGPGVDEPLMMQRAGAVSYYEADGLGTVTSLSTTAGALANTYTYDSFGKLTASTGTVVNSYRYTGRELDSETGMYYYRARYYDQGAGRFISEDPLRLSGGDTNFYAYVHNGPVGSEDPFGLARCFYQVAAHTLTCLSNYQPKVGPPYGVQIGPEGVHSGAGECKDQDRCVNTKDKGPITPGYYRMNLDTRPQHAGWGLYRLEPWPHHIYDGLLYRYGDKRGGFELHIGSITYGCINVDKTNPQAVEQYHNMQTILESQDGDNYLTVEP